MEPLHIIILGLALAIGGVFWQWLRTPDPQISALQTQLTSAKNALKVEQEKSAATAAQPQPPTPASVKGTGNPLLDKINAYLAKHGKTPEPTPKLFAMGGSAHGEIYITRWDASLGPWPEVDDGFTSSELRALPKRVPRFTTQFDKEKFRAAVDEFSEIVNQQMGTALLGLSAKVAGQLPRDQGISVMVENLESLRATYRTIDDLIFVRGSGGNGTFFAKYPSYSEHLNGILADEWQPLWLRYNVALANLTTAAKLVRQTEQDTEARALALKNMQHVEQEFSLATSALGGWVGQTNQRIDMTVKAI